MKRLKDPEGPISLFLERANRLGNPLLGPILVQVNFFSFLVPNSAGIYFPICRRVMHFLLLRCVILTMCGACVWKD
jgi:hypothetical protein